MYVSTSKEVLRCIDGTPKAFEAFFAFSSALSITARGSDITQGYKYIRDRKQMVFPCRFTVEESQLPNDWVIREKTKKAVLLRHRDCVSQEDG